MNCHFIPTALLSDCATIVENIVSLQRLLDNQVMAIPTNTFRIAS